MSGGLRGSPRDRRQPLAAFLDYWERIHSWERWLIRAQNRFKRVVGHSYAAGYTSGCAALLLSAFPEATPAEIRSALKDGSSQCSTALNLLLSDAAYKQAITTILAHASGTSEESSELIHAIGLALSYIEYRLIKGHQIHRGLDEFRTLQRILSGRIPSRLQPRFACLECEVNRAEESPPVPDVNGLLKESLGIVPKRFSREEEAIIAYDHDTYLNPRDIAAWYRKGSLLLKLGRTQDAALAFESALQHEPLDGNGWYYRARSFERVGRRDEAVAAIQELTSRWSDNPRAWYSQSTFFLDIGDCERALHACEQAIALKLDFVEAWRHKAKVLRRLNRDDAADESSDVADYCYPPGFVASDFGETLDMEAATKAWFRGDYRALSRSCGRPWKEELFEEMPPDALMLWGIAVKLRGEVEGVPGLRDWAAAMWKTSLMQDSSLAMAHDLLIDHFLFSGQLEQAMFHAGTTANSGTHDVGRLSRLMLVQELHGEFDEALVTGRAALRLEPYYWSLLLTQSRLLAEEGLTPEAMELAKRAYELAPQVPPVRIHHARMLCIMERWSEGIAEFEATVKNWPHSVAVRCELGDLYMRFGHVQAACGHWEAALRAKPVAVEPRLRLFRALAATGEIERAVRELESLLALKPGESRTYLAAGEFYYAIGQLDNCERELKHALWRGKEWALGDGQPDRWSGDDLSALNLLVRLLNDQGRNDERNHVLQLIGNIDKNYASSLSREIEEARHNNLFVFSLSTSDIQSYSSGERTSYWPEPNISAFCGHRENVIPPGAVKTS